MVTGGAPRSGEFPARSGAKPAAGSLHLRQNARGKPQSRREVPATASIHLRPSEVFRALRAAAPLLRSAARRGQLWRPACELVPAAPDLRIDYDVRIPMSDGSFVTANIFRNARAVANGRALPTVMSAHPYDASLIPARGRTPLGGPPQQYRIIPQRGRPRFSTLTSWEAPDPNFWTEAGYAVVNMNMPGFASSGGRPTLFGEDQARACWEAIEWVAAQPWSNGRVGLCGVSYLAISQYFVATCRHYGGPPPSLKAMVPWEGMTDLYTELFAQGGVSEVGFPAFWWVTEVAPVLNGTREDLLRSEGTLPARILLDHPEFDAFWEERRARLEDIETPMLVCGSFSDQCLHLEGSLQAFVQARSRHKWLYTHRDLKWDAFYSDEATATMREFFDCFLKEDGDQAFLRRAPVRLEVRSARETVHEVREEQEWPLARTVYRKLFLDLQGRSLTAEAPVAAASVGWDARRGAGVSLVHRFVEATEWTGYMALRLWMELATGPWGSAGDDIVLFAAVWKLDDAGRVVPFHGTVGNKHDAISRGQIAASRRALDETASTAWRPVLAHGPREPLVAGEVVALNIALRPQATRFEAGEGIRLVVAPREVAPNPPFRKDASANRGMHILHAGGRFDAHLLVPEIPVETA